MDELIGRLAAQAGIDDAVAGKSFGIRLGFLNDAPTLIGRMTGTTATIGRA